MAPRRIEVDLDDLSFSARIRETALQLVADRGAAATSIRAVAAAAGVSPGAVTHHYKTKEELLAAVHRSVEQRVREAIGGISLADDPATISRRRRELYDRFLLDNPHVAAYVRRMLLDGGPDAVTWFRELLTFVRTEMDELVEAGVARPLPDPDIGLVLYAVLAVVPHLLRPVLEPALDIDTADPAVLERFRAAVVDLLSVPLLASDRPAPRAPARRRDRSTS